MNWNSYSPRSWKIGTLRNLIRRAIMICSSNENLEKEIKHLENVFCEINEYPSKVVETIIQEERRKQNLEESTANESTSDNNTDETETSTDEVEKEVHVNLPFAGPSTLQGTLDRNSGSRINQNTINSIT